MLIWFLISCSRILSKYLGGWNNSYAFPLHRKQVAWLSFKFVQIDGLPWRSLIIYPKQALRRSGSVFCLCVCPSVAFFLLFLCCQAPVSICIFFLDILSKTEAFNHLPIKYLQLSLLKHPSLFSKGSKFACRLLNIRMFLLKYFPPIKIPGCLF